MQNAKVMEEVDHLMPFVHAGSSVKIVPSNLHHKHLKKRFRWGGAFQEAYPHLSLSLSLNINIYIYVCYI